MKFTFLFSFLLGFAGLWAQQDSLPFYMIEEEEVVLEFNIRDYEGGNEASFSEIFEMEGLDILAISKNPEGWSENGWRLYKVDQNIFQLRKRIDDFDEVLPWLSRYFLGRSKQEDKEAWIDWGYKDEKHKVVEQEDGNATFFLAGYPEAKKVVVTGSFNHWHTKEFKMKRVADGWELTLDIPEGSYEYKFIVDGEWMHDPANDRKVDNGVGSFNSILLLGDLIVFQLPGYLDAEAVVLSGSFSNWSEDRLQMERGGNGWFFEMPLGPGKHYYKFIVDGKWMVDPRNPLQQPDSDGNINSVLVIY